MIEAILIIIGIAVAFWGGKYYAERSIDKPETIDTTEWFAALDGNRKIVGLFADKSTAESIAVSYANSPGVIPLIPFRNDLFSIIQKAGYNWMASYDPDSSKSMPYWCQIYRGKELYSLPADSMDKAILSVMRQAGIEAEE